MKREARLQPGFMKALRQRQRQDQRLILNAVEKYADLGTGDVRALSGQPGVYRLRIGKWRALFLASATTLDFFALDNRGEAYRNAR